MPGENIKDTVNSAMQVMTKDLPEAVKENKGAVIGAAIGYFLGDTLQKNEGLITALLGGVIGHLADEKKKEQL